MSPIWDFYDFQKFSDPEYEAFKTKNERSSPFMHGKGTPLKYPLAVDEGSTPSYFPCHFERGRDLMTEFDN